MEPTCSRRHATCEQTGSGSNEDHYANTAALKSVEHAHQHGGEAMMPVTEFHAPEGHLTQRIMTNHAWQEHMCGPIRIRIQLHSIENETGSHTVQDRGRLHNDRTNCGGTLLHAIPVPRPRPTGRTTAPTIRWMPRDTTMAPAAATLPLARRIAACPARWPAAAYWTTSYRTPQTTWKDLPQYVRNIMSVTGPAATINGWPSGVMPI